MYDYQNFAVSDFSGGKTDDIYDGNPTQGEDFDNLYIQKDKKPLTRPGRTFYISAAQAQITAGNSRVSGLVKHVVNKELFVISARVLNYSVSSTWTALVGPVSSNSAFSAGAVTVRNSWSDWRGHTILCNDAFADPIKIYRDQNAAYQVRTAGLPHITLEGCIDLANDIRTKYIAHIADAAEHLTAVDATNTISAAAAHDFDTLITLITELLVDYPLHNADSESPGGAKIYHNAFNATTHVLTSVTVPTTLSECITILSDLKTKLNAHDADGTSHGTDSTHQVTASYLPTVTAGGGTGTYLYRFYYYFSYYVDGVLNEDFGPTTEVTLSLADTGTKSVANIPAIANGTTRCYDTATIKIYIDRTTDGGTTFYRVGSVTNGTTTYSDTTSDATLITNVSSYINGDVLDNDPPPRAKFFVSVNDMGVYANLKIGSKEYPNSFTTSIPGDVDSCPGSFQDEVEIDITGISSVQIYPIIFCRNRMYRLEGQIDEQGRGTVFKREVSRTKGCISNNGIVQIPQGLVFPGEDGFYFSDGFSDPQILSLHLITSYKTLVTNNETKIYGEYDGAQNRVLWCVQTSSSSSENDTVYALDLNFPIGPKSVFTTHSGTGTCFRPTALAFYNRTMVQADSRGYVFKYDTSTATDPKVDTTVAASTWNTSVITHLWTSSTFNFGTNENFKYIPMITLEAKNDTNTTLFIKVNKNDNGGFTALKEIRSRDQFTWGDPTFEWGSTDCVWNYSKNITAKRRLPAGNLRLNQLQIQVTNAYTNIYKSDDYSTAVVDAAAKTATVTATLPTDIVDYYISFETDDYTADYLITARTSSLVLTYSDPTNATTSTTKKWLIRGYKKGETMYLLSCGIRYAMLGQIQTTWKGTEGENA